MRASEVVETVLRFASIAVGLSLSFGTSAANTIFDFSYTGFNQVDQASGTLIASDNLDGSFTAISGSGQYDGFAITLILNPNGRATATSPSGYFFYDNQLFPLASPVINNNGLLFSIDTGTGGETELNVFSDSPFDGGYVAYLNGDGANNAGAFNIVDPPGVPEPDTFGLMAAGLLLVGLAAALRRAAHRERRRGLVAAGAP